MKLALTLHAIREALAERITRSDIESVLTSGEVIEDYPEDRPLPSRLVLGWNGDRPLHVVAAHRPRTGEEVIITVYEPDPDEWSEDFRRRL